MGPRARGIRKFWGRERDVLSDGQQVLRFAQDDKYFSTAWPRANIKDFAEAGERFRISVLRPGDLLKKVKA
jgi:hypothetical protein